MKGTAALLVALLVSASALAQHDSFTFEATRQTTDPETGEVQAADFSTKLGTTTVLTAKQAQIAPSRKSMKLEHVILEDAAGNRLTATSASAGCVCLGRM